MDDLKKIIAGALAGFTALIGISALFAQAYIAFVIFVATSLLFFRKNRSLVSNKIHQTFDRKTWVTILAGLYVVGFFALGVGANTTTEVNTAKTDTPPETNEINNTTTDLDDQNTANTEPVVIVEDNDIDNDGADKNTDCDDSNPAFQAVVNYYPDKDHDGLGDPSQATSFCQSSAPDGFVANHNDVSGEVVTVTPPPTPSLTYNCSSNSYNCSDFSSHSEAQAVYEYCMSKTGRDVHGLDRDKDGSACED